MATYMRAYRCRANQPVEMVTVLPTSELGPVIRDYFTIAVEDMLKVYLVTDYGQESLLSEIVNQSVTVNDPNWRNRLIRLRINGQHADNFIRFEYL